MTIGAGAYMGLGTFIEGYRIADLQWGTASGKYAVLRFCASIINASGRSDRTWCVALRNQPSISHSYVIPIKSSGNDYTNKEFTFIIPPPPTSTWATDNNYGLTITFMSHVGSTFQTSSPSTWVSGNFFGTNDITDVPGGSFVDYLSFSDVGFYADPNMTGRAPEFQQNEYVDDHTECLRYWYKAFGLSGVVQSATILRLVGPHPVPMRVPPSVSLVGTTLRCYDTAVAPNATSVSIPAAYTQSLDIQLTASAGGFTLGRAAKLLLDGQEANYVAVSAR